MIAYGPISTPLPMTASSLTIAVGCRTLLPQHRDAEHFRLGDHFAVDRGYAADLHAVRPLLQDLHFHSQLIAGNHRLAEPRFVDAAEEEELVVAVGDVPQHENGAALGHRFNDQDTGHHRCAGKMSLKEMLVRRDVL